MTEDKPEIDPAGYPLAQLAKALSTGEHHRDPEVRQRARDKAERWAKVFEGMLNGSLRVGSRQPLAGVPVWATPKVVTGGFSTGDLLAAGPLRAHEQALRDNLGAPEPVRGHLNRYYLSEDGLAALQTMLDRGTYAIDVPEEGALCVVAWLLAHDHGAPARALLDELAPFFARLRFYPRPTETPPATGPTVHRRTAREVREQLGSLRPHVGIARQREAVEVWAPLYDRMLELFAETVVGDAPSVELDESGSPVREPNGRYRIAGGWPCQDYPEGWRDRARKALKDYRTALREYRHNGRHQVVSDAQYRLRRLLERTVSGPQHLTGKDVGQIRLILARSSSVHGAPGSAKRAAFRAAQAAAVAAPEYPAVGRVVAERLRRLPDDAGVDAPDAFAHPTNEEEELRFDVPAGTPIPRAIARRVERALHATIEELVAHGIVTSGDTVAELLPQLSGEIAALGFDAPELRTLYSAIYRSFRQRRSLLLLNLEHQIRLEELPWVAAIETFRKPANSELPGRVLREVALLALTSFPQAIVPNKLLQELGALASSAEVELVLVDEVAADIFMGTFSAKFLRAAQTAASLLQGTLYETYYEIDYRGVAAINDLKKSRYGPATSKKFDQLCRARASPGQGLGVAANGVVIEQQQILTTQNLASLVATLDLVDAVRPRVLDLAQTCFRFVCMRHRMRIPHHHGRLIMVKQTAYAWRQMLFWLSLAPDTHAEALAWMNAYLAEQSPDLETRLRPAMAGLAGAMAGRSPAETVGARQFLGWTVGPHWILK